MHLNKGIRIVIILLLFFMLVLIRAFENYLFYDPFILYFENDYLNKSIPFFSGRNLLISMSFRYFLNTIISLIIIYLAFNTKDFVKFAIKFYFLAFIVLMVTFLIILKGELSHGYLFAFYIRRFIIHPLFVLLLIPAFYYKQLTSKEII